MKRCFKCGQTKPLEWFYRHPKMADGYLGKCKECTKQDVARRATLKRVEIVAYERERSVRPARRAKTLGYMRVARRRHPERFAARAAVSYAVRVGHLVRRPCEVCGEPRAQAHHEDYSRPLEVRWLCLRHHWAQHQAGPPG